MKMDKQNEQKHIALQKKTEIIGFVLLSPNALSQIQPSFSLALEILNWLSGFSVLILDALC
jgi:hypothetical protein